MKNLSTICLTLVVVFGLLFSGGCETKAQTGAVLGTLLGVGVGALVGGSVGDVGAGALIGGAFGAGGGYRVGNEGDKKDAKEQTAYEINQLRQETNTLMINIRNSNGSITPVMIRRQGINYIGPKGELYYAIPTEEQLKPIYGF